jgi:urease accessory protein
MRIEAPALLRLLAMASPAFPTGGFAYSQGLEWAVESAALRDAAGLQSWLADVARHGAGWCDAVLLRHAHRACDDAPALRALRELAGAANWSAERQAESLAQGAAFAASAAAWSLVEEAAYPVAFGVFAARQGVAEDAACLAFLANWAGNMISAAIRLGVLGQAGGLAVLAALETVLAEVATESFSAGLDDLGGVCFLADIASMRHETQYARLFRS